MLAKLPKAKPDIRALQSLWYKKLKDEGFRDIEKNPDLLNQWDSSYFQTHYNPDTFQAKQIYFYRAKHFLDAYPFPHPIQKKIWSMHSDGIGVRQIAISIGDDPYLSLPLWHHSLGSVSNKDRVNELLQPLKKAFMLWLRSYVDGDL